SYRAQFRELGMLSSLWRRLLHSRLRSRRAGKAVQGALRPLRRAPLDFDWLEDRINPSTTLNPLGSGLQIVIAGPDTVNLSTAGGHLTINDTTAGQSLTDTTGKFTISGAAGNQSATEIAALFAEFSSITVTGSAGRQTVALI